MRALLVSQSRESLWSIVKCDAENHPRITGTRIDIQGCTSPMATGQSAYPSDEVVVRASLAGILGEIMGAFLRVGMNRLVCPL